MKIRCIYNTGADLRPYEYETLDRAQVGRFGASEHTMYNQIEVGKEYLVMGMIMFRSYLSYLIDDQGLVYALPCQLFEVVDDTVGPDWKFRLVSYEDEVYPSIQAIWGYPELCADLLTYEKLVEFDSETLLIYFKRRMEFEQGG